ncbi:ribose-binding protein [Thermanaeromonas toyohensis ToBE]|uniref:Ribose-binding protein n=1 Tax=Thermanaeromonas toyohensis ToBE TaxID=698762 RepID=A0A1W1VJC7_9FIRM|nr:ribose ABC transporter substrate-binding protein RbsB [Thermanaeromonas toyohensis]SMB93479.1 ribose-binding protein [Thermanaeromonas toyohensis ToBE]
MKRAKFFTLIVVIIMATLSLLVGCGQKAPEQAKKAETGGASKATIGLAISTLNNPFFVDLRDGAQQAASLLGVDLIVVDGQNDSSKQLSSVEDLITKKVKVLLINPTDSNAIVPAIEAANKAGIPVITVDRAAAGGQVASHIASDNVQGGKMAAKFLIDKLGGKGLVVELEGIPGTSAARDRGKGFEEEISKAKDMKIIAKQTADFDRAKGMQVMENILQAQPKIDAVFAQNDEMALGAIEAIKGAKRENIIVVGFDGTKDALEAIKAGTMTATIAQKPKDMGRIAVETAVKIIKGEKVESFIPVPLELITKK